MDSKIPAHCKRQSWLGRMDKLEIERICAREVENGVTNDYAEIWALPFRDKIAPKVCLSTVRCWAPMSQSKERRGIRMKLLRDHGRMSEVHRIPFSISMVLYCLT